MPVLPSLSNPVTQALGWALLHSFWEAFIIFACLRLVLMICKNSSSATRYNLSAAALLAIFGWFVFTFFRQFQIQQELVQVLRALPASAPGEDIVRMQYIVHQERGLAVALPHLEDYFPLMTGLYLAGMFLCFLRSARDYRGLLGIRRKGLIAFDPAWEHYLDKLAGKLSVPRKVKLYVSEIIDVPLMAGWMKPMIYLPVAAINNLTPDQLEAILLHELSHIRRNDYLMNIIQTIIETILFFNPFVWWISKNIRKERENCCDDLVISSSSPLLYANALVALEEHRLSVNPLAMAASGNKNQLLHRIKRMMEMKTQNLNFVQKLLAVLVVTGTVASVAWLAPAQHDHAPIEKIAASTVKLISLPASSAVFSVANARPIHYSSTVLLPSAGAGSRLVSILCNDTVPAPGQAIRKTTVDDHLAGDTTDDNFSKADELKLQETLKNLPRTIDSSVRNIDWQKQQEEIQRSLREAQRSISRIDWKRQQAEIERSMMKLKKKMSSADWAKQRKEVALAMERAQYAVDSAMKNINWNQMGDQIKLSMFKADSAMKNVNWDKMNHDIRESMDKVRVEMDRAKAQWKNNTMVVAGGRAIETNHLLSEMKADNLIGDDKNYDVKLTGRALYINGKKQPAAVFEKYRSMVGDHATLEMKKHDGKRQTTINVEN